ncbi:MAG: putative toxin-antitoxin system toxin component, PIN family [Clostridiales Family XIII bacterium]|jgi:putative PIN family toxin of toxin-antitoxin system|nr:putative toxin-antitoxin system toxin component, PIN family [Clostridiales Family XIII bacterium]
MRIMLDTNVLVSMFLFPSDNMDRLKRSLCENRQILICSYVVDEIKDVVARKFPKRKNDLDEFFRTLPFVFVYTPECFAPADFPNIRDISDLPVLVSAVSEDVDLLITGDKDFGGVKIERPKILTPAAYLANWCESS